MRDVTTTGLVVHTSPRTDVLVDHLARLLAQPPDDPFAPEVVAVPTRGVERWLVQRLAHHLGTGADGEGGVCARLVLDPPGRLVRDVVAAAGGTDPEEDPWDPDRLTWHVLRAVDDAVASGQAWAEPLRRHLGGDEVRAARRGAFARRTARLLAAYGTQRPALVVAWAHGRDEDGAGSPVPDDLVWQPPLWRLVRERVGVPSPAERLAAAVAAVRERRDAVDLPGRLHVLGATRLPQAHLDVLDALAAHREVHLWLPHPSPELWDAAATGATRDAPRRRTVPAVAAHPVLASSARDAAELGARLVGRGAHVVHHPAPAPPPTVLGAVQGALRDDRRTPAGGRFAAVPEDRSVQVHACHGRARQVEVLREVLLGLLADDPTLEPRDVLVLCPDVEAFAPLVVATFGAVDDDDVPTHPGRSLRVRLADRSPARTNPLLRVLADLLALAGSRVGASAVVDLAGLAAVRHRFGLDDDDLARLRAWALDAGVRWGEDVGRRARYGLAGLAQGTWRTGTDRLLLGVAMAEEDHRFVGAALPLDDVASTDVDLVGRVAELLDRLTALLGDLDGVHPAAHWHATLERALTLLALAPDDEPWAPVEAARVLARLRDGGAGHEDVPLRLPDVVALLAPHLEGRPTRAGFRTGALTVCSLEPMRAVPHRVVCVLGADDGAFPRATSPDGDDLLARDPLVGERDRRTEDRQLFLDAVTSAVDHLVVVHSGADERTGAVQAPAVPVGELLDAVDECVALPGGRPARSALVVRHPLQTVDARGFVPGALGRPGPFSFAEADLAAARAARGPRTGRTPLLDAPLPPPPAGGTLDLDTLVRVLVHPVRAFVGDRLGVRVPGEVDDLDDRLPLVLDARVARAVGERLLTARLDGVDPDRALAAERRRGQVPPGRLGTAALLDVATRVDAVAEAVGRLCTSPRRTVPVDVRLADGRLLTGTVPDVHDALLVRGAYARLSARQRLRTWVALLAAVASAGGAAGGALRGAATVGRGPGTRPTAATAWLAAPDPATAHEVLGRLVAVHDRALTEPLPLPVAAAATYAARRHGHDDPAGALVDAQHAFEDRHEHEDEHHVLAWGPHARLLDVAGTPGDVERTRWPDEPTLLGALAREVWEPLLVHARGGPP
ncbi:exodeoxyribonuclease V subunit gamma [Cellulomonas oligotrophica]|uniref:RecBCD enzyme subunit RecC n=1 Tax=Cellulomonas oligotrophica TaxID=931536 RepID=A0ABQ4DC23_9CELL|nr:RecBCD enzyme subunit RecC [Cellulomonas oligotrophica]